MKYLKILSLVAFTGVVLASCGNDQNMEETKETTEANTPPAPPPPPTPPKTEVEVNMETPAGDVKVKTER